MDVISEQRRIAALPPAQWSAELAKVPERIRDRVRNYLRGAEQVINRGILKERG